MIGINIFESPVKVNIEIHKGRIDVMAGLCNLLA